jgi:hypothetical protein
VTIDRMLARRTNRKPSKLDLDLLKGQARQL